MGEENNNIDWSAFASPYWSPERGEQYTITLSNWRQDSRSYDEDKTMKPVLVFDVVNINGEKYSEGQRIFVTGAVSFANDARKIITQAELRGDKEIMILLRYSKDKKYTLLDLYETKKKYMGLKEE